MDMPKTSNAAAPTETLMTLKLVILYPHPPDPEEFDRYYIDHHLPLMRQLLGPDIALQTYKTWPPGENAGPYYRTAEIHFPDRAAFDDFVQSGRSKKGHDSAMRVSTGGKPLTLICIEQNEAPP
jgi:uncharacterized protein (TIGR02118 family)